MIPSRPVRVVRASLAALVVVLTACGRDLVAPRAASTAPRRVPSAPSLRRDARDPDFLEPAPDAPSIANPVISFWAVRGRDVRVKMVYQPRPDHEGGDSVVFAEFRVRDRSLAFRPDGSPIADGDSVLITMTLADPARGIIDFQPSGLRFSPKTPASLTISFENANLDLDGDGRVDSVDRLREHTFRIAVQDSPGDPWIPLPSIVDTDDFKVTTAVRGFSGYAIDY